MLLALELWIISSDFVGKLVKTRHNCLKIVEFSLKFGKFSAKIGEFSAKIGECAGARFTLMVKGMNT